MRYSLVPSITKTNPFWQTLLMHTQCGFIKKENEPEAEMVIITIWSQINILIVNQAFLVHRNQYYPWYYCVLWSNRQRYTPPTYVKKYTKKASISLNPPKLLSFLMFSHLPVFSLCSLLMLPFMIMKAK